MGYYLIESLTLRRWATHSYRSDIGYSLVLGLRANYSSIGKGSARSPSFTLGPKSFCVELIMLEEI